MNDVNKHDLGVFMKFNFSDNFNTRLGASIPRYIAYTEGSLEPRIPQENYSVLQNFAIADFNSDGLDDLIISYVDVYTKPRLYLSNGDGSFRFSPDWMPNGSERRAIRNSSTKDINADGRPDFVGFTAPHGFYENSLGPLWDWDEPNLVLLNTGNGFSDISSTHETYHHGGDVGDVNHDGLVDIFGISEFPNWWIASTTRSPMIQDKDAQFIEANWSIDENFPDAVISDIRIADLNRDGLDDIVLTLRYSEQLQGGRVSTPMDSVKNGVVAYAFGVSGKNFSELNWRSTGTHWMSETEWNQFTRLYDPSGSGANRYEAGPSLLEVIDVNSDGFLDLLVSFYASAGTTTWRTSGFIYLENSGSSFVDRTAIFFPQQASNRSISDLASFTLGFEMADLDGDGDRDLILSTFLGEDLRIKNDQPSGLIFLNNGVSFFPPIRDQLFFEFDGRSELKHTSVGDFNGDGVPDLVSVLGYRHEHVLLTHLNRLSKFESALEVRGGPDNDLIDLTSAGLSIGRGGAGDDRILGTEDKINTAMYWGLRKDYLIEKSGASVTVQALVSNEGTDSLHHIQRLIFNDVGVALDSEGRAGQAYRVYKAAFNREPDQGGLGYWIAQMDSGMNMVEVAARFIDSNEFRAMYGTSPTDEQYLTKVYQNVLGRNPETTGYNWWLNEIRTNPDKTRAKVLADFSESLENKAGTAQLVGQGIVYEPWVG